MPCRSIRLGQEAEDIHAIKIETNSQENNVQDLQDRARAFCAFVSPPLEHPFPPIPSCPLDKPPCNHQQPYLIVSKTRTDYQAEVLAEHGVCFWQHHTVETHQKASQMPEKRSQWRLAMGVSMNIAASPNKRRKISTASIRR